ncbi:hypothetical protein VSU01S_12630 [Vibrio superstes NBRC 103154]|uniref:Uncharacterized protein n=1 Tax=Vibrio superstes NBRC 103154 TaxID=1219062 RepID=A0A511QNV2_9VIBR|nr:hypothetical protein VSU01S_12630 [Vibrio superstes NBRC 103154]
MLDKHKLVPIPEIKLNVIINSKLVEVKPDKKTPRENKATPEHNVNLPPNLSRIPPVTTESIDVNDACAANGAFASVIVHPQLEIS